MSENNKNYEIIILSECSKEYKVGLELYKEYTKDEYFNKKKEEFDEYDPRTIHPTKEVSEKNNKFKIHFFDIQDRYWPAISNICKHCDGAIFAVDLDNYTAEAGEEFVNEWLVNLDDLDKNEMAMIIIGVTKSADNSQSEEGWNKLNDIANDKKIEIRRLDLKNEKALKDAFSTLFNQISKDGTDNNIKREDDDIEEILDKYKIF
jgi:signal recognition particle receptor subunit beta